MGAFEKVIPGVYCSTHRVPSDTKRRSLPYLLPLLSVPAPIPVQADTRPLLLLASGAFTELLQSNQHGSRAHAAALHSKVHFEGMRLAVGLVTFANKPSHLIQSFRPFFVVFFASHPPIPSKKLVLGYICLTTCNCTCLLFICTV